ncbi:MAG: EAL domain-containing protein [Campylobacterota bacterium]|nr:EAL domain-containing protein [Campylobacterota bacterium]
MNELNATKQLLEQYKNAVDISMIVSKTDPKGKITYANEQFSKVSKYSKKELIGKHHNIIRHPDTPQETFKDIWTTIKNKQIWKGIIKNRTKYGNFYYVDTTIIPILDENNNIVEYIGLRNDITKVLENEKILEKVRLDDITNLKSRTALLEDIEKSDKLNLALIDIKSFKHINDFYGHKVGDNLLKIIAKELKKYLENFDCKIYRIPIDIFAVTTTTDILVLQKHVDDFIAFIGSRPINIADSHIYVNAIVGFSSTKDHDTIYQSADIALQYAKTHNNKSQIYTNELNLQKEIQNNLLWTQRLNEAIYGENVKAFYQPIINNKTMKCEKFEALVRLIDENGNIISPFYFLDISKQTKLYAYLTKIVLAHTLEKFKDTNYEFSINLSVEDFENETTLKMLLSTLENNPIAKKTVIEITESEEIKNFNQVVSVVNKFKSFGCQIAIDDFGSGYSNFSYLMQLQADYIKIDGSLIENIVTDQSSQSIVKAIVSFAKEMNIKTIAEYVSSEEIFYKIKEFGIDYSQGFYFGIPKQSIDLNNKLLN